MAWAKDWTDKTGILTYFGEWMPQDSLFAQISDAEALAFTRYFIKKMKAIGVPWTLNTLGIYYNMAEGRWHTQPYEIQGAHQSQTRDWPKVCTQTLYLDRLYHTTSCATSVVENNPIPIGWK